MRETTPRLVRLGGVSVCRRRRVCWRQQTTATRWRRRSNLSIAEASDVNGDTRSETKVTAAFYPSAGPRSHFYARDHPPSGPPGGRVGVPQTPCLLAPADDRNALATTAGGLFWPCAYCTLAATPARSISLAR